MAAGHHIDEAQYNSQVKAVWRATLWLSIATILEVGIALMWLYSPVVHQLPRLVLNSFFILATLFKAFFIIPEFMHLKYEKRALILSLGVPIIFIIWAIIAFLYEGNSWLDMRLF